MQSVSSSDGTTSQSVSKHGPGQVIQSSPGEVKAIHKESRHKSRPDTLELHTCVHTMYTEVSVQYITGAPSTWETPNSEHVSMGTLSSKYISHYYTSICIGIHLKSTNPLLLKFIIKLILNICIS